MVSNHVPLPKARTTTISVCKDEPLPASKFRKARTLIPARAASVALVKISVQAKTLEFFPDLTLYLSRSLRKRLLGSALHYCSLEIYMSEAVDNVSR